MKISCVLVLGLAGLNTAAAAVAVVNSHARSVARAEPEPDYDPSTDIFFDPLVEAALLGVAYEVINKGSVARRQGEEPQEAPEPSTVTDADVDKAIKQMADKAPESKREAAKARLNSPEGRNFVKAMLVYFADGAKKGKKAASCHIGREVWVYANMTET